MLERDYDRDRENEHENFSQISGFFFRKLKLFFIFDNLFYKHLMKIF